MLRIEPFQSWKIGAHIISADEPPALLDMSGTQSRRAIERSCGVDQKANLGTICLNRFMFSRKVLTLFCAQLYRLLLSNLQTFQWHLATIAQLMDDGPIACID